MKKLLCLALSLALLWALAGCTPEERNDAKPVIYLYPEEETEVTVSLDYEGTLTCTYPAISEGNAWTVTASPSRPSPTASCGSFWRGRAWRKRWTSRPRSCPPSSAGGSPWWSGAGQKSPSDCIL